MTNILRKIQKLPKTEHLTNVSLFCEISRQFGCRRFQLVRAGHSQQSLALWSFAHASAVNQSLAMYRLPSSILPILVEGWKSEKRPAGS